MSDPNQCPSCGTNLPEDSSKGTVCPACMLERGFDEADSLVNDSSAYDDTTIAFNGERSPIPKGNRISSGNGGSASPSPSTSGGARIPSIDELKGDFPELEVVELIGRGGMGAVFKARQASLDRFVALKVLPADWNSEDSFRERFKREAKTLAALNHPNIVTIHDFGERNGRFFFTMEYVDGTDLARMIHGGEMKPEEVLTLIPPICEAVQFAHDHGVVHRDIKPGNILVGKDGRVKVVDFGIAKLGKLTDLGDPTGEQTGEAIHEDEDLTDPNGVLGTPRYMAPEQGGESATVDHRADLYALGVVFYEMLVGTPPPKGENVIPPLRKVGVDSRWDEIVFRALEENPDRRYQNATELKTAVEAVLLERKPRVPRWLKVAAIAALGAIAYFAWPKDETFVNSIGMAFVPVPGVEGKVSVWETRVKDFNLFVEETGRSWKEPPFEQTPDHPAVQVSWHEARAFCQWLTDRERAAGKLKDTERYRLPTDLEWSALAGLEGEEGTAPMDRHLGQQTAYPWGEEALIPDGAGNYPDESARSKVGSAAVNDYDDGFPTTAPVGSFAPNQVGLYDLGGNVWEWTESLFSEKEGLPTLRGGGWWASEADDGWKSLLSSHRRADVEPTRLDEWDIGFRVIRGPEPEKTTTSDLFDLVMNGDLEGVGKTIEEGADVNQVDRNGQPPVMLAADGGNLEMLKLLHQLGAKLETSDRRGRRPLHAAAALGDIEMVNWLLEQGVSPRSKTIAGEEPFFLAVPRAPTELLERLLEAGGPETLLAENSRSTDPLSAACLFSSDKTVLWVIEQLEAAQIKKVTPIRLNSWFMWIASRDSSLVKALLTKLGGPLTSQQLSMPLVAAVNYDNEAVFTLLKEALGSESLDDEVEDAVALTAVGQGRLWAIKNLMANGWLPDADEGYLVYAVTTREELQENLRSLIKKMAGKEDEAWAIKLTNHQLVNMPQPAQRETIRLLVEAGINIEERDQKDRTPLIAASMNGNFDAVETLLELNANVEARDNMGFTPLLCAVEKGNLDVVKCLERHGADFAAITDRGRNALHVLGRDVEMLRYLLEKKIPVDSRDGAYGMTPLIGHASYGDEEIVSLLLEAGADPNAITMGGSEIAQGTTNIGTTALYRACVMFNQDQLKEMDEAWKHSSALGNAKFAAPRYDQADRAERIRTVNLLLAAGADPTAADSEMLTPLHIAAKAGLHEVLEPFIAGGANVNALTDQLNSPLHQAASGGQIESVRILLKHKALVDHPAWKIPLVRTALQGGNPDVLSLLLEHKAPINRRDPYGAFPIHTAAFHGEKGMVEVLLKAGADVNVRDMTYRTPAHVAAGGNHRDVVNLLWKNGANLAAVDMYALTPTQVAASTGNSALAAHLDQLIKTPSQRPNPDQQGESKSQK